MLRWPVPRLVRLLALAGIAGMSLRGVWNGTTPLLVPAGLALWVAALDAIEPLAQETDHPGLRDGYPLAEGELMVRHLAVPARGDGGGRRHRGGRGVAWASARSTRR